MTFVPIALQEYVEKYLAANPGSDRAEITTGLKEALSDYRAGARCACGARIWVIGSASAGRGCFTCITGESNPESDYEIDEACTGGAG